LTVEGLQNQEKRSTVRGGRGAWCLGWLVGAVAVAFALAVSAQDVPEVVPSGLMRPEDVLKAVNEAKTFEDAWPVMVRYGDGLWRLVRKKSPSAVDQQMLWQHYHPKEFLELMTAWDKREDEARAAGQFSRADEERLQQLYPRSAGAMAVLGNVHLALRAKNRKGALPATAKEYFESFWRPPPSAQQLEDNRKMAASREAFAKVVAEQDAKLQAYGVTAATLRCLGRLVEGEAFGYDEAVGAVREYAGAMANVSRQLDATQDPEQQKRLKADLEFITQPHILARFRDFARCVAPARQPNAEASRNVSETRKRELAELQGLCDQIEGLAKKKVEEGLAEMNKSEQERLRKLYPPGYPRRMNDAETRQAEQFLQALNQSLAADDDERIAKDLAYQNTTERKYTGEVHAAITSTVKKQRGDYLELLALLSKKENWFALSENELALLRPSAQAVWEGAIPPQVIHLHRDAPDQPWRFKAGYRIPAGLDGLGLK